MKLMLEGNKKLQLSNLHRDECGLSTVEYVILLALIAVVGITVFDKFGKAVMENVDAATEEFSDLGG